MVKKLKEKMHTLLEARKENKGFTLVELIVVIVILAILVGVTIGGIYGYVNKSRINTDINNASAITSTLSVLSTNKNVCTELSGKTVTAEWNEKKTVVGATWKADGTAITLNDTGDYKSTKKAVEALLTDGFPAPKAGGKFVLTITVDAKGNMETVKCIANDDKGNALEAQE